MQYNEVVFHVLEKRFGKNETVVFARSATAGGQRFPVVSAITIPQRGHSWSLQSIGVVTANRRTKQWQKQCVALSV